MDNLIKIIDGLYITNSNIINNEIKYIININNKGNVNNKGGGCMNININKEQMYITCSNINIDYDNINNFIISAFKNNEPVIIHDENDFIVSFLICCVFLIKKVKLSYFDAIILLKYKLNINHRLYKKISYHLLQLI
jgi:hypothetical protein